jgi:hypothetical protein
MKKFFTLEESIFRLLKSPDFIKSFIDSELKIVDNINKGPDDFTVKKILDYAKALSVIKSKKTGNINVILN